MGYFPCHGVRLLELVCFVKESFKCSLTVSHYFIAINWSLIPFPFGVTQVYFLCYFSVIESVNDKANTLASTQNRNIKRITKGSLKYSRLLVWRFLFWWVKLEPKARDATTQAKILISKPVGNINQV